MMKMFMYLTISMFAFQTAKSACLTETELKGLGFSDTLVEAKENSGMDDTEKACGSFAKVCVEPSKLKSNIKEMLESFKRGMGKQFKGMKKLVGDNKTKINEMSKTMGAKNAKGQRSGKKDYKKEITDDQAILAEKIAEECGDDECEKLTQKFDNIQVFKTCIKSIIKLQTGAMCYMASDQASEFASVDTSGTVNSLTVKESAASEAFVACVKFYQTQCAVTNINVLASVAETGEKPTKKGREAKIQKACESIGIVDTCKDDLTKCSQVIQDEFLEGFMAIGKDAAMGEDPDNTEKDMERIKGMKPKGGKAADANARLLGEITERILEEATSTCEVIAATVGADIVAAGDAAGLDYEELSSVKLFETFAFLIIAFIF